MFKITALQIFLPSSFFFSNFEKMSMQSDIHRNGHLGYKEVQADEKLGFG